MFARIRIHVDREAGHHPSADPERLRPLGVPAADRAFVLLHHAGEERRDQAGQARRRREHDGAPRRVALVRHRRGTAAGFGRLADSSCISSEMSRAILPSVPVYMPHAATSAARRSRCVCHGASGTRQLEIVRERRETAGTTSPKGGERP